MNASLQSASPKRLRKGDADRLDHISPAVLKVAETGQRPTLVSWFRPVLGTRKSHLRVRFQCLLCCIREWRFVP